MSQSCNLYHVTRENMLTAKVTQEWGRIFFPLPDYKSMHLLEINYSAPLILHFQHKINYFTASLCKLQSLLFCFLPKHKNNNNNTLVFIAEPDAHKFDNGKINQRKVTCNVCTYAKEGAGAAVFWVSKYFSRSLKCWICTFAN